MIELNSIFEVHKNLFIGGYWPSLDFKKLKEIGITAIVNLMDENVYDPRPYGFDYLYRGFVDDWFVPHEYIEDIFKFVDDHLKGKNGKVLIHCARGVSRSGGIIVAWLLKEHKHWTWNEAVEYVSKSRLIYPAVEIKESILEYFESIENRRRE